MAEETIIQLTQESLCASAQALWRGLPFLWQEELRVFQAYACHRGEPARLGDLELWLDRVQEGQCPVVGSSCGKPGPGRFCAFHRPLAPPGM